MISFEIKLENANNGETADMAIGRTFGALYYIAFIHNYREDIDAVVRKDEFDDVFIKVENCPEWLKEDFEKFVNWVNKKEVNE